MPGIPMHIGQQFVLGCDPNDDLHPQKIFVDVESSRCVSSPIEV